MESVLMTVSELAEYLKLDKQTIYRLVKKKKIPNLRIGAAIRFNKTDIAKFLSEKNKKEK